MSTRTERVAEAIREAVAEALGRGEVKDPRVSSAGLVTVTRVVTSGDLRHARVGIVVHGADEAAGRRVLAGLASAGGYLRGVVGRELRLRMAPELRFVLDAGFEDDERVGRILVEIRSDDASRGRGDT